MSALLSPPANNATLHRRVTSDANSVRARLSWVRTALASRSRSGSPGVAFKEVSEHASELTPGLERLAAASFQSLLAPWQMPSMLDRGDAKEALEIVVEKITTRAEKRKHEAAIKRSAELDRGRCSGRASQTRLAAPPGLPSGRGSRPDRSRRGLRSIIVVVGCNLVTYQFARSNTVPVTGFPHKVLDFSGAHHVVRNRYRE